MIKKKTKKSKHPLKLMYDVFREGETKAGFSSKRFVFCLQQQMFPSLNDDCLTNIHVSAISTNTPLIAHGMGDIGYICIMKKNSMGAATLMFTIVNASISHLVPFSKCLL